MKRCPIEAMSNYSQNCWNDWNSAVLCSNPNSRDNKGSCWIFKDFYCSVTMLWELWLMTFSNRCIWTFARFVWPLLATIPCIWKIWSGSNNLIMLVKQKKKKITKIKNKKMHHRYDFEADTWPETGVFLFGLICFRMHTIIRMNFHFVHVYVNISQVGCLYLNSPCCTFP